MVDLSKLSLEDQKRVTRIHDDLVTMTYLMSNYKAYETREDLTKKTWLWDMAFDGLRELEGVNLDG